MGSHLEPDGLRELILGFGSMTGRARWRLVALFNVVGFVLLLTVMSIAIRSAPWPLRTFMNDPPVLLPLYAPYTWIVSVCVAMALWGHLVLFRWLWQQRPSAA